METYFDPAALIKIYREDRGSEETAAIVYEAMQIPITPLCELEIRNIARIECGSGRLAHDTLEGVLKCIDADITANRLVRVFPEQNDLYRKAEELSRQYTESTLCESSKILHVASAIILSCTRFITNDRVQANLAKKVNLQVVVVS